MLPDHEVVIFDEAHTVEDIMTAGLGVELSAGRLRALASASRGLLGTDDAALTDALSETAEELDKALRPLLGARVLGYRPEKDPRTESAVADEELKRVLGLARAASTLSLPR